MHVEQVVHSHAGDARSEHLAEGSEEVVAVGSFFQQFVHLFLHGFLVVLLGTVQVLLLMDIVGRVDVLLL